MLLMLLMFLMSLLFRVASTYVVSRSGANSVEVFHVTPIPYTCEANYSVDGSTVVLADVNNLALMGAARACLRVLCQPGGVGCASVWVATGASKLLSRKPAASSLSSLC